MNETKDLALYLSQIKFDDLGGKVVEKTKGLILDQLGCQLAFAHLPWNKAVHNYILEKTGCREEATLTFYGTKTDIEDVAFANAAFGHGFEMDDTEMHTITHPGSVIIPAALAVAEVEKSSGQEVLTAIVAGYDAMIRIGMAARSMIERSFHGTSVTGTFGSAVAASKLMNFQAEQISNAVGIAASQSGGIAEYTISGGSVKRLHAGFAAQNGIKAALLSRLGLTGPATVLEGTKGFCQAFANEFQAEEITRGLGGEFRIMWTGNKPYCCCAGQHAAIDATEDIVHSHSITSEAIQEIVVEQTARDFRNVGNIVEPHDITSAQFSGRFGVALRVIKGSNGFQDYTLDNLRDPEILNLVKKIKYLAIDGLENLSVETAPAIVTMTLKNGDSFNKRVDYAKGTLRNPMSKIELENKFRGLASTVLSNSKVEDIIMTVKNMENIVDIRELVSLLKADKS